MKKNIETKATEQDKLQRKISSFFTTSTDRKNAVKNVCGLKGSSGKRAFSETAENEVQSHSLSAASSCNNKNTFNAHVNEFQSKRSKILCVSPVKENNSGKHNVEYLKFAVQENTKFNSIEESKSNDVHLSSPKKLKRSFDNLCEAEKENVPFQISNIENSQLDESTSENELCNSLFEDSWLFEENLNMACETLDLSSWQYCKVLEIHLQTELFGKIIHIECTTSKKKSTCLLQVPWESSRIIIGDFIRIKAIPYKDNMINWAVNRHGGFIVTNPDNLISGTSVVGSLFCARKGVLSDMFKGVDCDSKIMTIGSLVHELFQNAIKLQKTNNINIPFITNLGHELLKCSSTIAMLYRSQMSTEEASNEIMKFVPKIVQFIHQHIDKSNKNTPEYGSIDNILDIEENLWMPQLGLKGKIDVTLQVKLHDRSKKRLPLELKTGRASFSAEHRGQLILYVMMMRELGHRVKSGLLLYIKEGIMKEIVPTEHEIRDLMMLRNEINYFLSRKYIIDKMQSSLKPITDLTVCDIELPEPINHHRACVNCPYLTLCSTFLSEGKDLPAKHHMKELSINALEHLSLNHIEYFKKWVRLLLLEENDQNTKIPNSQLWHTPPEVREMSRRTIANLLIEGKVFKNEDKFIHCFKKKNHAEFYSNIVAGDYVIISTDKQFNIISGYVQSVTNSLILISMDKDITLSFNLFPFHIDLYESSSLLSFNLTNLGVMLDNTEQSNKLRELIIDKRIPEFSNLISKRVTEHAEKILGKLNSVQQRAVLKVLTAKDYLLIQGMPGTGKTQTVVSIIKLMTSLKKSVLITSHTHSAVDNVLLKLHSEGINFLRLGSMNRVHPEIQSKSDACIASKCSSLEELEQTYSTAMIVGVTCLGSAHALLSQRKFDICIVDESTQVLQCSVLRPLFSADKFVLIGDPEQLPPVVKSKDAKQFGFDESLFSRLSDTGATVMLTMQYRMNSTITSLINKLTYKGLLECADHNVSQSTLYIPKYSEFLQQYSSEKWLCKIMDTALENSVKFVNTGNTNLKSVEYASCYINGKLNSIDKASKEENATMTNKICSNICEASIIMYILNAVITFGVNAVNVGIIAPFRDQVDLIQKLIDSNPEGIEGFSEVEVNTVDQYQGRDKDVIIYSCTKSRPPGAQFDTTKNIEGEILNDKRRLTVALTRSKQKLIIIGDITTLLNYKPFNELCSFLDKDHIVDLSNDNLNFDWNCILDSIDDSLCDKDITML